MIKRLLFNLISESFEVTPICALLGPRQCGKTTLAKVYTNTRKDEDIHFFDLEDLLDLARLDNPKIAFEALKGIIVIDEMQLCPNLYLFLTLLISIICHRLLKNFPIFNTCDRTIIISCIKNKMLKYNTLSLFSLTEQSIK